MTEKNTVALSNIIKNYDSKNVLNSLSWDVQAGQIIALLGKNGSGKTTLLECIMNIRQIQSGEIKLWDYSWDELPQDKREKIAYVSQEIQGFEWMRSYDFVDYLGGFFPQYDKHYAQRLILNWGIDGNTKISNLSKGQKQILHIIQALSIKPELLILDEPVAHLDPSMRRKFVAELIDCAYENKITILFSSHIISDVERVASHVAILNNKKFALEYDLEQLKSSIAYLKIAADKPLSQTEYFKGLCDWQSYTHGATAKIIAPLAQGLDDFIKNAPNKIEATAMSLEDWYLEVNHATN